MLGAGDKAPEFTLPDIQGHQRSLKEFIGDKPVLVTLFKISCPVCQMALPYIDRLSTSDNVRVIAISQDDEEATEEFRRAFGLTLLTMLDESGNGYPVSNAFGITHVPSMFLVEPDGCISMAVAGFSKRDIEAIGRSAGVVPFREGENVPEWKAG